jgi:hypothetical protein
MVRDTIFAEQLRTTRTRLGEGALLQAASPLSGRCRGARARNLGRCAWARDGAHGRGKAPAKSGAP